MKEEELFKKEIHKLSLLSHEKESIKKHLYNFPLEKASITVPVASPFKFLYLAPVGALALILILGTPLIYASNSSLPGEFLYPLKVNVVEKVQGVTVNTPEEKTIYHTNLAHKRLSEAAALIKQGEKDRSILGSVERRADVEAEKALIAANTVEKSLDIARTIDVKRNVKNTFEAHSQVFATLYEDTKDPNAREFAETLGDKVRAADSEVEESVDSVNMLTLEKRNDIVAEYISEVNESVEKIIRDVAKEPMNISLAKLEEITKIEDTLQEVQVLISSNKQSEAIEILSEIQEKIELPKKVEEIKEDVEELSPTKKKVKEPEVKQNPTEKIHNATSTSSISKENQPVENKEILKDASEEIQEVIDSVE